MVRSRGDATSLTFYSAGRRDSALTNHGIQQARRLGSWLADNRPPVTRVFTSPLQRAFKTANAICSVQGECAGKSNNSKPSIVKVEQLVEQDFGFYEGKPSYARQHNSSKKTGREAHHDSHKDDPGFVDVEAKASLAKRSDDFLDTHLLPMFDYDENSVEHMVVVVSHGILLSHLWRRLLLRLPERSVRIASKVATTKGQIVLEHLGGWSNTGFLELRIQLQSSSTTEIGLQKDDALDEPKHAVNETVPSTSIPLPDTPLLPNQVDEVSDAGVVEDSTLSTSRTSEPSHRPLSTRCLHGYATTILTIDGKAHLQGFKRTRGGIGRAQYDEKQKTMDSFFKRARKA